MEEKLIAALAGSDPSLKPLLAAMNGGGDMSSLLPLLMAMNKNNAPAHSASGTSLPSDDEVDMSLKRLK